jgi:hypothetical protein
MSIPGVLDINPSGRGKQAPVPCMARGDDAVKHIDTSFHALKNILWKANAHEVTRLFSGKVFENHIRHLPHDTLWLTYAESAHSIAIEPDPHEVGY